MPSLWLETLVPDGECMTKRSVRWKKLQAQVGCGWVTRSLVSGHPYMVGFNWIWKESLSGKGVHSNLSPVALAEMTLCRGNSALWGPHSTRRASSSGNPLNFDPKNSPPNMQKACKYKAVLGSRFYSSNIFPAMFPPNKETIKKTTTATPRNGTFGRPGGSSGHSWRICFRKWHRTTPNLL